jgi:hypothetical protein
MGTQNSFMPMPLSGITKIPLWSSKIVKVKRNVLTKTKLQYYGKPINRD